MRGKQFPIISGSTRAEPLHHPGHVLPKDPRRADLLLVLLDVPLLRPDAGYLPFRGDEEARMPFPGGVEYIPGNYVHLNLKIEYFHIFD
jgi:hypothetical protein